MSVWVKQCDDLKLEETDREQLDSFIDDIYSMIEEVDKYDENGMEQGTKYNVYHSLISNILHS